MMPKHLQLLLTFMLGNSLPREVGHSKMEAFELPVEPQWCSLAEIEQKYSSAYFQLFCLNSHLLFMQPFL
jgi:hypothetical protein